ncbi:hypothetical protein NDU88_004395 [Pleurodeles waltl]|uniref:Uncharacterized protein n=1 Tax=Pleurodeles waltl TaxID=8319 RepID=A0AAV7TSI4_PLEWA|nr:hypothetical protein NDU88_004395 [Pleurodeles waltl]
MLGQLAELPELSVVRLNGGVSSAFVEFLFTRAVFIRRCPCAPIQLHRRSGKLLLPPSLLPATLLATKLPWRRRDDEVAYAVRVSSPRCSLAALVPAQGAKQTNVMPPRHSVVPMLVVVRQPGHSSDNQAPGGQEAMKASVRDVSRWRGGTAAHVEGLRG